MNEHPARGRGTASNPPNRFTPIAREKDEEAWTDPENLAPGTRFFANRSKSALVKNDSPDVGPEVTLNPYRGCEHGCVYCYARPTHEYFGMSAGLDFETKILVKEDLPDLLRKELSAPKYQPRVISQKILNRIREIRGGKLNDPRFHARMRGEGVFADEMEALFTHACKKAGLPAGEAGIGGHSLPLSTASFRRPKERDLFDDPKGVV